MGWKLNGSFPYELKKFIIIVAPHTSSWDFVIGVLGRSVGKIDNVRYLGKKELFRFPYGWFFRWLGGYPVARQQSSNMVDTVVAIFDAHDEFRLALAPEGTRKKVTKFRSGFYHIARNARVPIVMVGFDFEEGEIKISNAFYTTENSEMDMEQIMDFFRGIRGKNPEFNLV